ncbi:hypothetical protein GCM10007205_12970 [Oxalicibacterium flavum]|uniref:Glycosyltransferase family 1 protein n=1 Tax=Oxalicibacterium flavum TaxID=179467 RepID=A0A8J2UPM1_9BURK|nr:glycosyltransferase family 4 protein [Oxalicibacterium flavum]GGC05177.1 hypothetical protein GCM10007205_12970 [Oxalicibacterium flavum]
MKNNRILIVSVDFLPSVGGISTMIHHLANALVGQGCTVAVLGPQGSSIPPDFPCEYDLIVDQGSNVKKRASWNSSEEEARIFSLLEDIHKSKQFDCIMLMHPFYYGTAVASFCFRKKILLTSFFYGYELRSLIVGERSLKRRILDYFMGKRGSLLAKTRYVIGKSDHIFAISGYTKNLVTALQPKKTDQISISGCGISVDDYSRECALSPVFDRKEREERRLELSLSTDRTIGFAGRLVPSKNVDLLVRALKHAPNVQLVVFGDGPERIKLQRLSEEIGVSSRITWLGAVSEETKWQVLRAIDVLVLPSKELPNGAVEGFGIVLLEGTAAGAPVIAARSGGMTDVVTNGNTGFLCDPNDEKDLADKVLKLVGDDALSIELVERARSQIDSKFNWNSISENVARKVRG